MIGLFVPMIDGDIFSPRIRHNRCDVRIIKQLKSLFRNKKGIENDVTYIIHKYSSALNNYTIQAANKKSAGHYYYIITEIKRYNLWTSENIS